MPRRFLLRGIVVFLLLINFNKQLKRFAVLVLLLNFAR